VIDKYQSGTNFVPLFAAFVLRLFSVCLAASAGGPGGMLFPSFTLGTLLGPACATMLNRVFGWEETIEASMVLGMAGMFAGWFRMPVTAVIIVYELTGMDHFVLHSMLCSCCATFVASSTAGEQVYHRGVHAMLHQMDADRKKERKMRKSSSNLSPEKLAELQGKRKSTENGDDVVSNRT
jgi:CIC family chloride channel protein